MIPDGVYPRPRGLLSTMMNLYALIMTLAVPLMLARLLVRSRSNPGYRRALWTRLGFNLPPPQIERDRRLWIHAVSVGETLAIAPLVEKLLSEQPDVALLITSTTPTGADQVRRRFGRRVDSAWVPFDTPGAVSRFLDHWQPAVVAMVETEIWPQIIRQSARRGLPTLLLNARLSRRSTRGYARVGTLSRPVLAAFDHIAGQHRSDARRFLQLGARAEAVSVVGSLKFDIDADELAAQARRLRAELGLTEQRPVLLAASTHPGEESQVLAAFAHILARYPDALLMLAPRHPERAAEVIALIREADLSYQQRSSGEQVSADSHVLLVDTLGELGGLTGLCRVAFVGGSLVPHGGHNPLEAAALGVPVLTGPHRFNFSAIFNALLRLGAASEIRDAQGLAEATLTLFASPSLCQQRGQAGHDYLQKNKGALQKQYALLVNALKVR